MDIDIDVLRTNGKVDEVRHMVAGRNESLVGLLDGLVEIRVLHEAPVDEEILVGALLAGSLRFTDKTADAAHLQ